jgi:hypothetical protein
MIWSILLVAAIFWIAIPGTYALWIFCLDPHRNDSVSGYEALVNTHLELMRDHYATSDKE